MGALDAANYARQEAAGAIPTPQEFAQKEVDLAYANLNAVLDNPKSNDKQIQKAFDKFYKKIDKQVSATYTLIDNYSKGSSAGSGNPGSGNPGNNGNEGLGGSLNTSPTPTPPTPPPTITPAKVVVPVKTAPIDTLVIDQDAININFMTDLIFENIGGQELINIARNDTVNGQILSYQPIKNLTKIQQQYNPNNIVGLQNTSDKYFLNFPIKLETKLLGEGDGAGPDGAYVYIEEDTGDLIIELINLEPDEQLEVQISVSGTIYEAEFNESW